ncbi:SPX-domain-containing protein [Hesseltinella vesiculosa]|uniref:SPX-domain-containing protein n=1 Tax=Hesseltinella vesiculosa TaxID=101127 RepID=A0A1X2GSV0_9FUNG|nr:SPX-domain-containing protein [Hesseltinella vesiculosa]
MKFSHSLVINAVPEWLDYYIDYDHLKKIVYKIERVKVLQRPEDAEQRVGSSKQEKPRIDSSEQINDDDARFLSELDKQLQKIVNFYQEKSGEILEDASTLREQFDQHSQRSHSMDATHASQEQPAAKVKRNRSMAIQSQVKHPFYEHRRPSILAPTMEQFNQYQNFRARCATTYINLFELKSYIDMNKAGFRKILKKWDKVTGSNLKESYFEKIVMTTEPFLPQQTDDINKASDLVVAMYAAVFTKGDTHAAIGELKLHMRDHITFERNTVWKDMVGKEREKLDAHAADVVPGFKCCGIFISWRSIKNFCYLLVAVAFFAVFMCIDVLGDREATKCLALLLFAAVMWAFEAMPLYATSYLIPVLIPPMHIIKQNGEILSAAAASKLVFGSMFNGTIMVLLGGFAIAAALSKFGVAKAFASTVLSHAGERPAYVILVVMYLACFLCMWISNVATPVLCFSLVQPILRTLPPMSTVGPALILGIALASCVGGLTTPISSPQNIITLQYMKPSIGWAWLSFSLPIAIITILTTWGIILIYFKPWIGTPRLNKVRQVEWSRPSFDQVYVSLVCLLTIALWCSETAVSEFWGDNGVIAAIPIVLLFGTGHLTKTDLNNFLWSVVLLAQGGMALGFGVQSSGLLDIIGHRIAAGVAGIQPLGIVFIFGVIVLVFATFVSHTVAALIIIPIVQEVGNGLHPIESNLLVTWLGKASARLTYLLSIRSVSGFPNMSASMLEDPTGKTYLKTRDFIFCGVPSSIVASVITILLGYGIVGGIVSEPTG